MKKLADKLSGVLFLGAFLPYIIAILHHETTPSVVTWTIFAVVDSLAVTAMKKEGTLNFQIIGGTIGAWIIAILAFMYGDLSMGLAEVGSAIGALTGIILWKRPGGSATLAIIWSQIALFVGAIPMFKHAYLARAEEDPIAWAIWFVSCALALVAIKKWDIANALQPMTFMLNATIMFALVILRPLLF